MGGYPPFVHEAKFMNKGLLWMSAVVLAAAIAAGPHYAFAQAVNVSVLYTGDTHGHLQSFFYDGDKPVGGVAKRAIYFQDKRRHQKMIWLTLDSGDAISGTALSDVFQGYLDIEAMNRLKYDAMALGVHEFDYGLPVLQQRISEAKFPVLSANVVYADTGETFTKPYVILERGGIKIAIFGLTTAELENRVAPAHFTGLKVLDPIETARTLVPQLRGMADVLVAVTHLGINEDIALSGQVPGIDLICGGMSHSELQVPMKVGQTLVVHDGYYGRTVGLLKLSFNRDAEGRLKRVWFDSQVEPLASKWVENSDYQKWLASYKQQLLERMGTIVGSTAGRMGMAKAKSSETELGNLVCDTLRESAAADIAILPAAFFKSGLPEGPITLGELFTALPYDHYGVVLNVTGGELQEILDDAANQIGKPGFPQISGASMGLFNAKAYNIKVNGVPVDPFARYRLVTSDQLGDAGLGYATMGTITDRRYTGRLIRDVVRERLSNGETATSGLFQRIVFLAQAPAGQPAEPRDEPPAEEPAGSQEMAPEEESQPAVEEPGFLPDEPASEPEEAADTRLDRNGEPMDDTVRMEEEIITDTPEGLADEEASEELEPQPPAEEQPAEAPAEDAAPEPEGSIDAGMIGSSSLQDGALQYEFYVQKVAGSYEFHLVVTNTGSLPVPLVYATGELFDFALFDGNTLVWNYNFNQTFMQAGKEDTFEGGDQRDFKCKWDGMTQSGESLAGRTYRFEATHMLVPNPVRLEFTAELQ